MEKVFDLAIIGGGISGCAAFYVASQYTDIKKVVLLEKNKKLAQVSSSQKANSQTIHDGSIETNYTAQKATKVKISADKLKNYALRQNLQNKGIFKMQKLAIGVGDKECEFMKKRHSEFAEIFDGLQFFEKEQIKDLEPKVIESLRGGDRSENVVASGYEESWCAMNFEVISNSFVESALIANPSNKVLNKFRVIGIYRGKDGSYMIHSSDKQRIRARFVLVNAGSFSLPLAQKCGYGKDLGCLPVAGSFYFVPGKLLRGKVYGVQNPKLPFAALHGDPDIAVSDSTRLGPTALAMPKLERGKHFWDKISGELLTTDFKLGVLKVGFDLLSDSEIRAYVLKNMAFELPLLGKRLFIKDARKIIPSLKLSDLTYANGFGEVRPQVIDLGAKKLELGEKKILTKKGLTFNMTPSPGATSCVGNAEIDIKEVAEYLGCKFDNDRFRAELG